MPSLRLVVACGMLLAVSLAVSGCGGLQPLYGTTSSTGNSVASALAEVEVTPIPGRVGQQVRNELIFKTTGGDGRSEAPLYRLQIVLKETAASELVDRDADVGAVVYGLTSDYQLIRVADNTVLHQGRAVARAPYDKVKSIFADIRARRDAEDRAARSLADSIRTQVAAVLSKAG